MKAMEQAAAKTADKPKQVAVKKEPGLDVKVFGTLGKIGQCPRNVNDVYSLGTTLQHYIESRYLELASLNQWTDKDLCKDLAEKQLEGKRQVDVLRLANLNQLLIYFYDNGGPIIEDPVPEQETRMIMPFFNRIMINFEKHIHAVLMSAIKGKTPSGNLEACVNGVLISTYSAISDLYQDTTMQNAFMELADVTRQFA